MKWLLGVIQMICLQGQVVGSQLETPGKLISVNLKVCFIDQGTNVNFFRGYLKTCRNYGRKMVIVYMKADKS